MGFFILAWLKAWAWFYWFLPRRLQRAFGAGLGVILRKLRLRERIVEQNLQLAYPGDTPEGIRQRDKIHRAAYRHLGELSLEILLLLGPMRKFCKRYGELRGIHHWLEAKARGQGAIFLASHVGNWEIMAATGGLAGIDLLMVTKHLKPEWLHQAIERGRASCGVRATYEPRTLKDVLAHLKRNGTVGFVLDQYAGPPVSVRVPVFNQPVGTSSALAMLARRTGAAILPVVNYRDAKGRLIVEIQAALPWEEHPDPGTELGENTARYSAVLERHIYEHPEQWLWIHRRFKGDLSPLRADEWAEGRARR